MTNDAERVSDIVARLRALADKWGREEEGGPSYGRLQVADEAADIIEAQSKALAEARHELWTTSIALGVIAKWPRFYFNRFYVEEWVLRTVVILRRWGVREPDAALTVHGGKSIKNPGLPAPSPQPRRTPMADQTNAEVSDERLRDCPFCGGANIFVQNAGWQANTFMRCPDCRTTFSLDNGTPRSHADTVAAWNRRSVTSQASEGEVVAWQWKQVRGHTWRLVESEHGRAALAAKPDLYELRPLYASPVSKRVERLETDRQQVALIIDPHAFMSGEGDDDLVVEIVQQSREDALRKADRVIEALQGGRS